MAAYQRFTGGIKASSSPATIAIIVLHVVGFIVAWSTQGAALQAMMFDSDTVTREPWTLLTYAFTNLSLLSVAFGALWFLWVGGTTERDLGTGKFVAVFLLFTGLPALALLLGALATGNSAELAGWWVPISALTVIWGTRYPTLTVMIFGVFPVLGKYIAMFSAALVFFDTQPPPMAFFVAVPLILAWAYAADKLPVKYGKYSRPVTKGKTRFRVRDEDNYFDDVKRREKEREERERLRKLFEDSMGDEDR